MYSGNPHTHAHTTQAIICRCLNTSIHNTHPKIQSYRIPNEEGHTYKLLSSIINKF